MTAADRTFTGSAIPKGVTDGLWIRCIFGTRGEHQPEREMPLLKVDVVIPSNNSLRRVAIIRENPKGDVYLTFPALREGDNPNGTLVQERRISIHPSWRSSHTTIKYQIALREDPLLATHFAHTTAPRNLADLRFFPVYATSLTNLSSEIYNPKMDRRVQVVSFDELDVKKLTGVIVAFVGPTQFPFPAQQRISLNSKLFQIVLFLSGFHFPSNDFGEALAFQTPSLDHRDGVAEIGLGVLDLMRGLSPSEAIAFRDVATDRLAITQIQKLRHIAGLNDRLPYEDFLMTSGEEASNKLPSAIRQLIWPPTRREFSFPMEDGEFIGQADDPTSSDPHGKYQ